MEIILALTIFVIALCALLYLLTKFISTLKDKGSIAIKNGFEAKFSVVPLENKKEDCSIQSSKTNEQD